MKNEIIFAGMGKIGYTCLLALQKKIDRVLIVQVDDKEILELKREKDVVISNFQDSVCKYVFLAGWYAIITEDDLIKKNFINIHGSLLPKYRGMHSIFWAIMNYEKELGYTIHEVNNNIDDGDIIYQYKFEYKDYTVSQVHEKFYNDLLENLGEIILKYINGDIILVKQDKKLATWVPRRNLDDCVINFEWTNKMINRFFLALTLPYPLPRIIIKNICYEVLEYKLIDNEYFCDLGRVINIDEEGIWIKTKEGFLIISLLRNTDNDEIVNPRELLKIGYRLQ